MKIMNLSSYEKLKIRAVDIRNLDQHDDIGTMCRVDPESISLDDLKPGYLCKTAENVSDDISNIYMYLDKEHLAKLYGSWVFDCNALVRPNSNTKSGVGFSLISYYKNTWPKTNLSADLTIVDVWMTEFDLSNIIKSPKDFISFYKKHNIGML